jgi:hypothetical protein
MTDRLPTAGLFASDERAVRDGAHPRVWHTDLDADIDAPTT